MNRFRLALCLAALTLSLLSGCHCCWERLCCSARRPCCPTGPDCGSATPCCNSSSFLAGGPVEGFPVSTFAGPVGQPGCTKGCAGTPASNGTGGPIFTGPPTGGFPVIPNGPTPNFPAPFSTTPEGFGPGPTTLEPPPANGTTPLNTLPRLTPTPGTPPAQPIPADPVSRTKK